MAISKQSAVANDVIEVEPVLYRKHATASPERFVPDLAMSLNNLSYDLSATGDTNGALDAINEGVVLYRKLATANPERFEPDLARSLWGLGNIYRSLENYSDAQKCYKESIDLIRPFAEKWPGSDFENIYKGVKGAYQKIKEKKE